MTKSTRYWCGHAGLVCHGIESSGERAYGRVWGGQWLLRKLTGGCGMWMLVRSSCTCEVVEAGRRGPAGAYCPWLALPQCRIQ